MSDGNLASDLIGGAFGLAGGAMSHHSAKSAQKRSFRQTQHLMKNQIQWKAQDLENAGFNRLLAAGVAGGGAPSMSPAQTPDFAGAITGGIKAGAAVGTAKEQRALLRDQQEQSQSSTNLNTQLAEKAAAEARLAEVNAAQAEVVKGWYEAFNPTAEQFYEYVGGGLNRFFGSNAKDMHTQPSQGFSAPSGSAYQRNFITPIVDVMQRLFDPNFSAYDDFKKDKKPLFYKPDPKPKAKTKKKPKHEPRWEFN